MATTPAWPNLSKGNTGVNVKALQCLLNYRNGNTALTVDGSFGPSVYNAVVAYQKIKGLTANGIAGKDTLSSLVAVVKQGTRNEAVRGAQHLLSKFETLDIDGSFGPGCLTAVKSFQGKMAISVDGSVGPTTWQYLFGYSAYPSSGGSSSGNSVTPNGTHSIAMPCACNQKEDRSDTWFYNYGCAVASAVMVSAYYAGKPMTKKDIPYNEAAYTWNTPNVSYTRYEGKTDSQFFELIRNGIDTKHPVVICICLPNNTSKTHFVVAYAYTGSGSSRSQIMVLDPVGGVTRTLDEAGRISANAGVAKSRIYTIRQTVKK